MPLILNQHLHNMRLLTVSGLFLADMENLLHSAILWGAACQCAQMFWDSGVAYHMNREKLKFAIKWGLYAFFVIAAFGPLRTFFSHSLPGFLLIPKVNFPVLPPILPDASSCHRLLWKMTRSYCFLGPFEILFPSSTCMLLSN
ncbi:hypothetical protein VP01_2516g1 [Puccinia sorghi]|uniref:Uncharacterized protein n=1 Tax=Puccinia sorghi TaxID=27349 RepID=A0A0L6V5F5_9BASI|nr:hypothetical protein VP01_2516g1 [Puccinia sorghi]